MGTNIENFNFNKLDIKISDYDYWDFYLYPWDNDGFEGNIDEIINLDFNNDLLFSNNSLMSLSSWKDATTSGITLTNIGLTGLDNGLISFVKDNDETNRLLEDTLTGSTYTINSGNTGMIFNPVSGYSGNIEYPIKIISGDTGNISELCGGFYQGFYKIDGRNYQVLPERFNKGWGVEYWLKKEDCVNSGVTINDLYPNNKGLFFYLGTRSENKFWSRFEGNNTGLTGNCLVTPENSGITITNLCTTLKETDLLLENNEGDLISLSPPNIIYTDIENKFLIYNRGKSGLVAKDDVTNFKISGYSENVIDKRNKFITFHRGNTVGNIKGIRACNYSGDTQQINEIDYKQDLYNNALGFIIKDDNSIGYRSLTLNKECNSETKLKVNEGYSKPNIVPNNEWVHIFIRFVYENEYNDNELKCGKLRLGKLMFYINGKLKHIEKNVEEIVPKRLNEDSIKQEGVGFNISVGGGSLGLSESITFDGLDPKDENLEIINNFGGSFIGKISQFKMYKDNLSYSTINNLFEINKERYGLE